jgi:hypothetical protein
MGAKPEDTERQITQLRADMSAALDEVERRLRGGLRGVATAEARITSVRTGQEALAQARDNPALLGVGGGVAAGAVVYGAFALINGLRERGKPQNRLKRGVKQVRGQVSERVSTAEGAVRQLEQALMRSVLLKLQPEEGGFVRVTDARLEPPNKKRGRSKVIKKVIWAALLSVFMALGSVLARRVADTVWRAMVHEEPPTEKPEKSKVAS